MHVFKGRLNKVKKKTDHLVARDVPYPVEPNSQMVPLGHFSEQAMESMHSLFNKEVLANHLPIDQNHPRYGELLVQLMVKLNGRNI